MKTIFLFIALLSSLSLIAQQSTIQGKISNAANGKPIAYANVYNLTTGKGTLSNIDGYFEINIKSMTDSIQVSFIGFQRQFIDLQESVTNYTMRLEETAQLLSEIIVTPKDDAYLFDLIKACRKNSTKTKKTAKAYYELKTYEDSMQIELVEGFYNLNFSGYDLEQLQLKAGRLALQPVNNRFFISLESSRAINSLQLWTENDDFPNAPTNYSKRKGTKRFFLYLNKKYIDDNNDSIYVINYEPRQSTGTHFTGIVWINKSQESILKIKLQCDDCQKHPFRPLFPTDSLLTINFNITKSFETIQNESFFKHVDFNYMVNYKSRIGKNYERNYTIESNAVLYAYDFYQKFRIPSFSKSIFYINDYQKINAFPYNEFFWNNNDEYSLNDSKKSNERFFLDSNSLTNITIFDSIPHMKNSKIGLLERPYMKWSRDRIFLREIIEDTIETATTRQVTADKYNLSIRIFVDINNYNDSFNVVTATIFDPFESFYRLEINLQAQCFINMYFDICEIQRRKLEKEIISISNNPEKLDLLLEDFGLPF